MSGTTDDFAIMQFSTDALPERERIPVLRDFFGPVVVRLDLDPLPGEPVKFDMTARASPELTIASVTGSGMRSRRTRALIADNDDGVSFCVSPTPALEIVHCGRTLA